ncbi:hypothetical protein [Colwellia sp. 12G3]|uniref:hypothetical protein n=1 Tax=Colwellia sp. 12G3 TaxID=2058299 RepID=UPI0012FF4C41|nr:hypothetical protein [Colwellia sp. 12G3]
MTLWRGYLGVWEIKEERLYLIQLNAEFDDDNETTIQDIFPVFSDPVFAPWCTGELRITEGDQMKYEHKGFSQK